MSTPSITPAQIVAAVGAVCTELLNAALISGRIDHLVIGLAGIIVPLGWMLADAWIRHGRAKAHAAIAIAAAAAQQTGPVEVHVDSEPAAKATSRRRRTS